MGTKASAIGPGMRIKVRYLGDAEEPQEFIGAATREVYHFGGRINLGEVDTRDLATGLSYAPGLFEMKGPGGADLFTVHIPLKRKAKEEEPGAENPLPGD